MFRCSKLVRRFLGVSGTGAQVNTKRREPEDIKEIHLFYNIKCMDWAGLSFGDGSNPYPKHLEAFGQEDPKSGGKCGDEFEGMQG